MAVVRFHFISFEKIIFVFIPNGYLFSENLTDSSVISVNYGLFNGHKSLKGKLDQSPVSYSLAGQPYAFYVF